MNVADGVVKRVADRQRAAFTGVGTMSLRINDIAPDFTAETTQGTISFHDWIGDGWAILFSHPKNFTPVCTTELGTMAGLEGEFKKRNVKIIGISVDPVASHDLSLIHISEPTRPY